MKNNKNAILLTTIGKIIFNDIFPADFPYINESTKTNLLNGTPEEYFVFEKGANIKERIDAFTEKLAVGKEYLGSIIAECFRRYQTTLTSTILDNIKGLGFTYSTKSGITIAVSDVTVPLEKDQIIKGF